jgi:diadenosine tetraphosphate (Ap4A) HIT family hydrolase
MLYYTYLKKLHTCPFCNLTKDEILKSNKSAILTLAKAPYTEDHLLVVPRKHVLKLRSLKKKEKEDMEKLILWGLKKTHKKYKNVSILYRDGDTKTGGKSIAHLHAHIIPKLQIGATRLDDKKRELMSEKEYVEKIKKIKNKL